ncbi:MAG: hypothetical protein ACE5HB_09330 [Terriglobia bacterium]
MPRERLVQNPLAQKMLRGEVLPGDNVVVDADAGSGRMTFERECLSVAVS